MNIYKKLFSYVPTKVHYAYISTVLSIISGFLMIIPYWYLWKFLEQIIVKNNLQGGKFYATVIVGLMIAYGITYFSALWVSHLLAFRLETNLRKEGIKHLMKASFAFFDTNSSGKIRKIIDDNAAQTHTIVAHLIPDTVVAIITPILMIVVVFMVDIKLGILLLIMLLIGIFQIKAMTGSQEFMKVYMESLEKLNAQAVEYVRGMQVVKIFRTTIYSFKVFYNAITSYSKYALDYAISCRKPFTIFQLLFNIFVLFTLPFAINFINAGEDKDVILAKIVFYACFAGVMFVCLMRVMYVGMYNFQASKAVEKIEDLFQEMKKNEIDYGNRENFENYDIEFDNVSFKYEDDYIIENLSFKLEEKRTYALVGSSGGGKSTIAKLISGFYNIDSGKILIGSESISSYSQEALMKNIAFVFQNTKLFKTSIYENVKIGNENASDEEILKALSQAKCDDILDKFEKREHTIIGSKGVHLSGGEIQRIAIARAILKNANIIILDEASAAADPENEYEIQQAFSNLMKDKTVIMIAHRLSSIRNVDEILVVDSGKIIERGTDKELIQLNGRYKALQDLFSKANNWRVYDR